MKSNKFIYILFTVILTLTIIPLEAQVKVTDGADLTLDANSLLELESTNKGLLIPRLAINNLNLPAPLTAPVPAGMMVYSTGGTVANGFYHWSGTAWVPFATGVGSQWTTNGTNIYYNTGNVGIGATVPAEALEVNGNIKVGSATTGTIRATKELVFQQDGDEYGTSILRLRNRTGENGAIFETTNATTLVDFIFKTTANQRNIRFESRATMARTGAPSFHIGGASPDNPTLSIGDNYSAFNSRVKIGNYVQPTALLHLNSGTTAAGTAPLKFTSGALLTAPEAGAIEFLGDMYYGTITTGAARRTFAFLESPTFTGNITAPVLVSNVATGTAPFLVTSTTPVANLNIGGNSANVTGIVTVANGGTNSATALSGSSIIISNGTSIIQGAKGTATTVLHGNAAGLPAFGAVSLTTDVSGTLPVSNGGTGLSSGTSGGIPAYTGSTTMTSSGVLAQNALVIGGGAGATPSTISTGTAGQLLTSNGSSTPSWEETEKIVYLNASVSNSTTTLANATGLSFTPEANKDYYIEFNIIYTTSATNKGITLSVNGPSSPTGLAFEVLSFTNATTIAGRTFNVYDTPGSYATAIAGNNYASVSGILRNGANSGTFILRFAAENSATSNIEIGSILKFRKLN